MLLSTKGTVTSHPKTPRERGYLASICGTLLSSKGAVALGRACDAGRPRGDSQRYPRGRSPVKSARRRTRPKRVDVGVVAPRRTGLIVALRAIVVRVFRARKYDYTRRRGTGQIHNRAFAVIWLTPRRWPLPGSCGLCGARGSGREAGLSTRGAPRHPQLSHCSHTPHLPRWCAVPGHCSSQAPTARAGPRCSVEARR